MPTEKLKEITALISTVIESLCQCTFPSSYIADEALTCQSSLGALGRLISTNETKSFDLLGDLEKWASSNPTITIHGTPVQVIGAVPMSPYSSSTNIYNTRN